MRTMTSGTIHAPGELSLMWEAVRLAEGKCRVCGGPCRPEDARRCAEPGASGDDVTNWSAMCPACRGFLAGKLPPPARHTAPRWHAGWLRNALRRLWWLGLVLLSAVAYLGLWALVAWCLWHGLEGPLATLGVTFTVVLLLLFAWNVYLGAAGQIQQQPTVIVARGGSSLPPWWWWFR